MSQTGSSGSLPPSSAQGASPVHESLPHGSSGHDGRPVQQELSSRSDTRSAITFRGLIEGSDDHQWIIADAIRDVDTRGRGGAPRHRWLVHTVTDGFSPLWYTARVVGQHWAVEARSPEQLAEAIRIQFPRSLRSHAPRSHALRSTVRTNEAGVGPLSHSRADDLTEQGDLRSHVRHVSSSGDGAASSPSSSSGPRNA